MAWAGTSAVLLRGMTLDTVTLGNLCQPPLFHTLGQAGFAYQGPVSKNRIQGMGLLFPITSGRMLVLPGPAGKNSQEPTRTEPQFNCQRR